MTFCLSVALSACVQRCPGYSSVSDAVFSIFHNENGTGEISIAPAGLWSAPNASSLKNKSLRCSHNDKSSCGGLVYAFHKTSLISYRYATHLSHFVCEKAPI